MEFTGGDCSQSLVPAPSSGWVDNSQQQQVRGGNFRGFVAGLSNGTNVGVKPGAVYAQGSSSSSSGGGGGGSSSSATQEKGSGSNKGLSPSPAPLKPKGLRRAML